VDRIIFGKSKKCVTWIHFAIGDIKGNNWLAGAFNCSSGKAVRHDRMCKCSDLNITDINCNFITVNEINDFKQEVKDRQMSKYPAYKFMKQISHHNVVTVWE